MPQKSSTSSSSDLHDRPEHEKSGYELSSAQGESSEKSGYELSSAQGKCHSKGGLGFRDLVDYSAQGKNYKKHREITDRLEAPKGNKAKRAKRR